MYKRNLLLVAAMCLTSAGVADADGYHDLLCRGGGASLRIKVNGLQHELSYAKSDQGAGSTGEKLRPGQCAWIDRPTSAGEPTTISMSFNPSLMCTPNSAGSKCTQMESGWLAPAAMFQVILFCSIQPACVFRLTVTTQKKRLVSREGFVEMWFSTSK